MFSVKPILQYWKSVISDNVLINISKKFNVNGHICEILPKLIEHKNKHRKIIEDG